MTQCSSRMGHYKVNVLKVKKSKKKECIVSRYAYEVSNRHNNHAPRGQPEHDFTPEIIILDCLLFVSFGLILYTFLLYKLFDII